MSAGDGSNEWTSVPGFTRSLSPTVPSVAALPKTARAASWQGKVDAVTEKAASGWFLRVQEKKAAHTHKSKKDFNDFIIIPVPLKKVWKFPFLYAL